MEEVKDAKDVEVKDVAASSAASAAETAKTAPAGGEKTEVKAEGQGTEEKKPWHEDPRFKDELGDLKTLKEIKEAYGYKSIDEVREAMESFKSISEDADFATFLAFKANKEKMSSKGKEEVIDFSKMTAEEFVAYNKKQSEDSARKILTEERDAVQLGDQLSKDLKEFVSKTGVSEEQFKKEYAPEILKHYEKIPGNLRDAYIVNNPPVNVFKLLYFDRAKEAGVKEYKDKVDEAKKANFEEEGMGGNKGKPKDNKSKFEEDWDKLYGHAGEVPLSAFEKSR